MKFKRRPFIPLLITLLSVILLFSCDSGTGLNYQLYGFLEQNAKTAIDKLNDNYNDYSDEASKSEQYASNIENLKLPRFENTQNIYDELKFLGGYWVSDGNKMLNTTYISYEKDAAGNIHYNFQDMPTENYITETYKTINSIRENEENLKWAVICQNEAQQTSKNIDNLKTLLSNWEVSYKNWTVNKVGSNLFSISGNDLGLYLDSPSIGQWQYSSDDKIFEPIDTYAENLYAIIFDIPSYEEKRAMYDLTPAPYKIPNYNYSWLSYFDYYHLTETVPLEIEYSRESEETQALFEQYPKLEEYWTMLEELGFNVQCTTVGEENGYYGNYNILLSVNS